METGRIEPSSRISISKLLLKNPMLYPSPMNNSGLYANAHAQCDVQHTHKQNYIEMTKVE